MVWAPQYHLDANEILSVDRCVDGNAMPKQAKMIWNPSVPAICARSGTTLPGACAAASRTFPLAIDMVPTFPDRDSANVWASRVALFMRPMRTD